MSEHRWTTQDIPDQGGRVAIVTGANSGIGFEAAKALAEKGATVVLTARSQGRGEQAISTIREAAPEAKVELMLCDLAKLDSVRAFVEAFKDSHDRLDLLINNAGVMMPPTRQETADGFELQFGTNHLGHFALTLPLLKLLTATENSRVVNVSSTAQNFARFDVEDMQWTARPFHRMGSYGSSKVANMLFSLEQQRRFDAAGAASMAVSCHPGWTATNLQRTSPLFRLLNPIFGMRPPQGALPTLFAATSPDAEPAGYYGPHGLGNMRGYPVANQPSPAGSDAGAARRLWELSEQWVGIGAPGLD